MACPSARDSDRHIVRRVVAVFLFVFLCTIAARAWSEAQAHAHRSPPGLLQAPPGRALVYFVNDLYPAAAHIYVDDEALGILPRKSYTAVISSPGVHLLWGTSEARWYEFKPGWAYLLRLVKVGAFSSAWVMDNPGLVGALVADKQLAYVRPDADTHARLRSEARRRYESAVKAAGGELALPQRRSRHLDFETGDAPMRAGR